MKTLTQKYFFVSVLLSLLFSLSANVTTAQDYAVKEYKPKAEEKNWLQQVKTFPRKNTSQWAPLEGNDAAASASQHFHLFGKSVPEFKTVQQYVSAAYQFKLRRPKGTVYKVLANKDKVYYHEKTKVFAAYNSRGLPITLFRAKDGIGFYNNVIARGSKVKYKGYTEPKASGSGSRLSDRSGSSSRSSSSSNRGSSNRSGSSGSSRSSGSSSNHYLKRYSTKIGEKTWLTSASGFRKVPTFNWHKKSNLKPQDNAKQKYEKHKGAFPELKTLQVYINAANQMGRKPPAGTREKKMTNGDRVLYEEQSNVICVFDKGGMPKTMFRPIKKLDYFLNLGVDKKTKYGDKWVAVKSDGSGSGASGSSGNKGGGEGAVAGGHRMAPKTALGKAAVKNIEPQLARRLSSRKSWDAVEQVMVDANMLDNEQARILNAFKDLIPSNASLVQDFTKVSEGSLIGFFKQLPNKKELLISMAISLGNGQAAGIGHRSIGVGKPRAWAEMDLTPLQNDLQSGFITIQEGSKKTKVFVRHHNPDAMGNQQSDIAGGNGMDDNDDEDLANDGNQSSDDESSIDDSGYDDFPDDQINDPQPVLIKAPAGLAAKDNPATNKKWLGKVNMNNWVVTQNSQGTPAQFVNAFYQKHKASFPEIRNAKEYLAIATAFLLDRPKATTDIHIKSNGDIIFYHAKSKILGIYNFEGKPYTLMRAEKNKYLNFKEAYPKVNYQPDLSRAPAGLKGSSKNKYKTKNLDANYVGEDEGKHAAWGGRYTRYFDETQRQRYEIFVKSGKLVDRNGKPVTTKGTITAAGAGADADFATYAMDENGRLYFTRYPVVTQFHHSSFLAGGPVAAAGEIKIINGKLMRINNSSGHYKPSKAQVEQVLTELKARGYNTGAVKVEGQGGSAAPSGGVVGVPAGLPDSENPAKNRTLLGKVKADQWMGDPTDPHNRTAAQIMSDQFAANKALLPEINTKEEYLAVAHAFLLHRPKSTEGIHIKANGDILFHHSKSKIFGAYNFEGKPFVLKRLAVASYRKQKGAYPKVTYKADLSKAPAGLKGSSGKNYKTKNLDPHYHGEDDKGNKIWPGRQTRYFDETQRQRYEIFVKSGKLVDWKGKLVSTKGTITAAPNAEKDMATFVMDENGRIYYTRYPVVTQFHHSSFLAGGPVAGAGEIKIIAGVLKKINTKSGHYKPSKEMVAQVLTELKSRGYRTAVKVDGHAGGPAPSGGVAGGPSVLPASENPAMNKSLVGKISMDQWMPIPGDPRKPSVLVGDHFAVHKASFPEIKTEKEYLAVAHGFLQQRPKSTNGLHIKSNGDIVLYHGKSKIFGAYNFEGKPYILKKATQADFDKFKEAYPKVTYQPDLSAPPAGLEGNKKVLKYNTKELLPAYKGEDEGKHKQWGGRSTRYFDEKQRQRYEIFLKNGLLVDRNGKPINTIGTSTAAKSAEEGMATYVMDENGRIYYTRFPILTQFHHSSFLAGGPVAAAGEIKIIKGKLVKINNASGHYKPGADLLSQVITELSLRGYQPQGVEIEKVMSDGTKEIHKL